MLEIMESSSAQSLPPFEKCGIGLGDVVENKKLKKSLQKVKVSLDKILDFDTLSLVESCVPVLTGTFCF
jgi:hypothetical protein